MKMSEELKYKGKWWLPNEPKKQISGTLVFSPNEESKGSPIKGHLSREKGHPLTKNLVFLPGEHRFAAET